MTLQSFTVSATRPNTLFTAAPFESISEALGKNTTITKLKINAVSLNPQSTAYLQSRVSSLSSLRMTNTSSPVSLGHAVSLCPALTELNFNATQFSHAAAMKFFQNLASSPVAAHLVRLSMSPQWWPSNAPEHETILANQVASTIGSLTNLRLLRFVPQYRSSALCRALGSLTKLEKLELTQFLPSIFDAEILVRANVPLRSVSFTQLRASSLDATAGLCHLLSNGNSISSVSLTFSASDSLAIASVAEAVSRRPTLRKITLATENDQKMPWEASMEHLANALSQNLSLAVSGGLFSSPALSRLLPLARSPQRKLHLSLRKFSLQTPSEFPEFVASLGAAQGLVSLDLQEYPAQTSVEVHRALANCIAATQSIRSLSLRAAGWYFGNTAGPPELGPALEKNTSLTNLSLHHLNLNDNVCAFIAKALLVNTTLRSLSFPEPAELSRHRLKIMRSLLRNPSLTHLRLGSASSAQTGVTAFSPAEKTEFESIVRQLDFSKKIATHLEME